MWRQPFMKSKKCFQVIGSTRVDSNHLSTGTPNISLVLETCLLKHIRELEWGLKEFGLGTKESLKIWNIWNKTYTCTNFQEKVNNSNNNLLEFLPNFDQYYPYFFQNFWKIEHWNFWPKFLKSAPFIHKIWNLIGLLIVTPECRFCYTC